MNQQDIYGQYPHYGWQLVVRSINFDDDILVLYNGPEQPSERKVVSINMKNEKNKKFVKGIIFNLHSKDETGGIIIKILKYEDEHATRDYIKKREMKKIISQAIENKRLTVIFPNEPCFDDACEEIRPFPELDPFLYDVIRRGGRPTKSRRPPRRRRATRRTTRRREGTAR